MCKMNWKTWIFRNLERTLVFLHFLTKQSNWSELPRKWKMENFEVFLKNKWLKCPKPIIPWYHSIVGITIKRLVHIAGLQINPSSQNLSSKLKSGPNYPVWRYLITFYGQEAFIGLLKVWIEFRGDHKMFWYLIFSYNW